MIAKDKYLGPNWKTIRGISEPRNIYKDPFMQHVRDKLDLIAVARKCIEGRELVFSTLFHHAQESISKRENTADIFYFEQFNYPMFSSEWEAGAMSIALIVDNDGKTLSAGIYILPLKAEEKPLEDRT